MSRGRLGTIDNISKGRLGTIDNISRGRLGTIDCLKTSLLDELDEQGSCIKDKSQALVQVRTFLIKKKSCF